MYTYVRAVVGGTLAGARALADGSVRTAIHWNGGRHHAKSDAAAGFCYVNDINLAIFELQRTLEDGSRVMYVDIDCHHGDGVEQAFWSSDRADTPMRTHCCNNLPPTTSCGSRAASSCMVLAEPPWSCGAGHRGADAVASPSRPWVLPRDRWDRVDRCRGRCWAQHQRATAGGCGGRQLHRGLQEGRASCVWTVPAGRDHHAVRGRRTLTRPARRSEPRHRGLRRLVCPPPLLPSRPFHPAPSRCFAPFQSTCTPRLFRWQWWWRWR